jgi:uncharacterized protein (UPF0332 family)
MDEKLNRDTVLVYLDGAREALRSARYNLDGGYYGVAVNRAYYAFFYTATALLLTLDITRSKHVGVLAAFREHFVKTSNFPVEDSQAYGRAFESRNIADYEMLGKAAPDQARAIVGDAEQFVERCAAFLAAKGYRKDENTSSPDAQ